MITCYTDGCRKATGLGGWGFLLTTRDYTIFQGGFLEGVTNNISELQAIIEACDTISKLDIIRDSVLICSDSNYCVTGINQWMERWKKLGWCRTSPPKNTPIANKEHWQLLCEYKKNLNLSARWVKGHHTSQENCFVDRVACFAHDGRCAVGGFVLPNQKLSEIELTPHVTMCY